MASSPLAGDRTAPHPHSDPQVQSPPPRKSPERSRSRGWLRIAIPLGALAVLVAVLAFLPDSASTIPTGDLVAVKRGPLAFSVSAAGSIRSADALVIKNRVEGQAKILWIIEEGTRVEAGDKLIQLDSSNLEDEKLEEEIEVESSQADYINAKQRLEIAKKQGQANIEAAQVAYKLALLDLEKYAGIDPEEHFRMLDKIRSSAEQPTPAGSVGATIREQDTLMARAGDLTKSADWFEASEGSVLGNLNALAPAVATDPDAREEFRSLLEELKGSYKLDLKNAYNNILLAEAELERARDRHQYSEKLFQRGFISGSELEADELDAIRREMNLDVANEELELLAEFTYKRTMEELLSAANQKAFELEKARHEAEANVVDAQANVHARQERLVRDEQQLREIKEQLEACVLYATRAGMVVYGTTGQDRWDREEPLAEGVDVRERQDLFRLPTTDNLVADIKIHESMLEYVAEGLPVKVTSDALPDRVFAGFIEKIAVLPDAQSRWMNPDLKVYNTTVQITGHTSGLRTGMSCKAEIIIEEFEDTIYLPIQSVVRIEGRPFVYCPGEERGGLVARPVEVGLDDNQMIQVLAGIEEGELVSLSPPLDTGEIGSEDTDDAEALEGEGGDPGALADDADPSPFRDPRRPRGREEGFDTRDGRATRGGDGPRREGDGRDSGAARARRGD